jgi:hypothetical protein
VGRTANTTLETSQTSALGIYRNYSSPERRFLELSVDTIPGFQRLRVVLDLHVAAQLLASNKQINELRLCAGAIVISRVGQYMNFVV